MASEMVEKVARALHAEYAKLCEPLECAAFDGPDADPRFRQNLLNQARAAIEAMREPSDAMSEEGGYLVPGERLDVGTATCVWQAMIDAALEDAG